ncbi:MAG: hypothetical protein IIX48_08140 [Lachnospiraceae bacterium]|nr:hypothetical protein [Lachnospiraceae bacterium]
MDEKEVKVAYQNKDIVSKIFGEAMKEKSLKAYGLNVPKVVDVLPTNLPALELNELRIDNIFVLEDGSYAIIDYESKYRYRNKVKYLSYVLRILRRLMKDKIDLRKVKIRIIIIYTADVKRGKTEPVFQAGAIQLITEEAFLIEIDGEKEYQRLLNKIEQNQLLDEEDMMKMIILPLAFQGIEKQREIAKKVVDLIKHIKEMQMQRFLFAGVLSFTDKVIDEEVAEEIRRRLEMTKVGRIIYEEKIAYGKEVEERVTTSQIEKAVSGVVSYWKTKTGSMLDAVELVMAIYGYEENEAKRKVEQYW